MSKLTHKQISRMGALTTNSRHADRLKEWRSKGGKARWAKKALQDTVESKVETGDNVA